MRPLWRDFVVTHSYSYVEEHLESRSVSVVLKNDLISMKLREIESKQKTTTKDTRTTTTSLQHVSAKDVHSMSVWYFWSWKLGKKGKGGEGR